MIKIRQYKIERVDKSRTYYIWGRDADEAFFRIGRHIDPKVVSTRWTGEEKEVSEKAYNKLMKSQIISGEGQSNELC